MKFYHVDAFTNRMFSGNPAGVCIMTSPKEAQWMQNFAAEVLLPETAFLLKQGDDFSLRWFAPKSEVDLCGHATLAAAHILREKGILMSDEKALFHTKSGLLTASKLGKLIELDFPIESDQETTAPPNLIEGLKVQPTYIGKNRMDYIIEVKSENILREIDPDNILLKKVPMRGVIVTCRSSNSEYDFVSRFFAPSIGIDEDPVTGSAHCCLGPYWQRKMKKNEFHAYQASKRGGVVGVRVGSERVYLSGEAVTVFSADLKDE
jgi:PhzF family phenazine biosynthesis protein